MNIPEISNTRVPVSKQALQQLQTLVMTGAYKEAIVQARNLISNFLPDANVFMLSGAAMGALNYLDEAVEHLSKALEINPRSEDALYNLALVLAAQGKLTQAADKYRQLFVIKPDHANTIDNLSAIMTQLNEVDEKFFKQVFMKQYRKFFEQHQGAASKTSVVVDFRAWCKSAGISLEILDSSQKIEVHDASSNTTVAYATPPTEVVVIPKASFVMGWDHVIAPTGEILNNSGRIDLTIGNNFVPHLFNPTANRVAHVERGLYRY